MKGFTRETGLCPLEFSIQALTKKQCDLGFLGKTLRIIITVCHFHKGISRIENSVGGTSCENAGWTKKKLKGQQVMNNL